MNRFTQSRTWTDPLVRCKQSKRTGNSLSETREAGKGQDQLRVSRELATYILYLVGVKRLGGTMGGLDEYRIIPVFMEKGIKMKMIFYTQENCIITSRDYRLLVIECHINISERSLLRYYCSE